MKKVITVLLLLFYTSTFMQLWASQDIKQPKVKWRFKTDGPIRGAAIISGEKIYFGSSDGYMYALQKDNGNLLWKTKAEGAITSSPSLSGSFIYFSTRNNDVYALDSESGAVKWRFKMQPDLPAGDTGWDYFMAAPVISNDQVLIGSGDGYLYSLNCQDGTINWKFKTNGRIRANPLVESGVIYQPSNDGFVYALNVDNGKLKWKFETDGANYKSKEFGFDRNSIYTQPKIENNILVFGSRDGNTYGLDLNTHDEKWRFAYGTTWAMATNLDDNRVFVGWSTNNIFSALDLNTGKELWSYKCNAHAYSTPLILDSAVYFGSADGNVYSLNKFNGNKNWEYEIGSEVHSSILYDSKTIFFGSDDGSFYALEDGKKPYKAVFHPTTFSGNTQYLLVDQKITPFFKERGFDQLDSAGLYKFIDDRITDRVPSVVLFALPLIPKNIIGSKPASGMIRQYLEAGGKIIWMGDVPNYYEPDEKGKFKRDANVGSELLGLKFSQPNESGNYYSRSTQEGLNWGLPNWVKTTNSTVEPEGVIPFAYDEFGRVSLWMKKYHPRAGSGFISCRTWSWNVPIKKEDLELLHKLAIHELE